MSDRFQLDRDGFDVPPGGRIVFGPGRVDRVGALCRGLGLSRVLLVTDEGLARAGHVERVLRALEAAGVSVVAFAGTSPEPTTADVDRALAAMARGGGTVEGFVALGGGSCLDTAKGAAILAANGGRLADYRGFARAKHDVRPIVAIPTTAGTGSETQSFALLADADGASHFKLAIGVPSALPRIALLDPTLTVTQPRHVTAAAGADALGHAVECAVTRARSAWSLMHAREAFRLIASALPVVLARPDDLSARGAMQLGAALAGLAIEASMLGAAHAAANPLSARYGTVHGHAVAAMLPAVVRWNAEVEPARSLYADLARAAGLALARDDDAHAVAALEDTIARLLALAALPRPAVARADVPSLAAEAAAQWTAGFNPRPAAADDDFAALYAAAFAIA